MKIGNNRHWPIFGNFATLLDLVIILKFETDQIISTTTCYYKNDIQILKKLNSQSNLLYGQH